MESWVAILVLYLASVAACIAAAVWYSRRPPDQRLPGQLPLAVIVVAIFMGVFGLLFLLFWYLNHKPYRDALGPPPP